MRCCCQFFILYVYCLPLKITANLKTEILFLPWLHWPLLHAELSLWKRWLPWPSSSSLSMPKNGKIFYAFVKTWIFARPRCYRTRRLCDTDFHRNVKNDTDRIDMVQSILGFDFKTLVHKFPMQTCTKMSCMLNSMTHIH